MQTKTQPVQHGEAGESQQEAGSPGDSSTCILQEVASAAILAAGSGADIST